ncbi:diguanylate cyclase [Bowmanella yangjiangensis]|uniref:diguanylate cyclase n=1 Tax=Bowmanella yangjiangensis TaxID=2811230 RepID=A0ABS3CU24_9ALTE|nr:diguanylate cyclase [Bowmanella yangjiangensis]MBN7820613.1 GGDEF domain-containing protein [Bowmanella yangjiangensis]
MMQFCRYLCISFCLLFTFSSQASSVVIKDLPLNLTHFELDYFVDEAQTLAIEDVAEETFSPTGNYTTLGTSARVTWYKLELRNEAKNTQEFYIHLPYAYHVRSVAFYEFRHDTLVRSEWLDMNDATDSPLMYRGTVVYPVNIAFGDTLTLYVRSHVYSHQWFALNLHDSEGSKRALIGAKTDIALMVGMMLALVFYNGLLYFATSKKENIYYSFYLISGLLWIALSYGLLANLFGWYGDEVFTLNLSLITMPIFLLLFVMSIFETKRFYPTEHRFLQFMLVLLSATLIYGFVDISGALKPASSLAALMMVITFSVSISLYRKGNPLVKYFLIGHSFFVLFNGMAVLFYKGLIAPSYISHFGVGIGIVLEALTLAFIISYRIKILEDIRHSQEELKRQAATDPLTKLYNRRYFYSEADYLLEVAKTQNEPLSVLVTDIDHFKRVNDTYGHQTGDKVIVEVAATLKKYCRSKDLIARFGGEEFVMLLPGVDEQEAHKCAKRILEAIQSLVLITDEQDTLKFTVSIGVVEVDLSCETVEMAVNRADKALYQAKHSGRNRICTQQKTPD